MIYCLAFISRSDLEREGEPVSMHVSLIIDSRAWTETIACTVSNEEFKGWDISIPGTGTDQTKIMVAYHKNVYTVLYVFSLYSLSCTTFYREIIRCMYDYRKWVLKEEEKENAVEREFGENILWSVTVMFTC